MQQLIDDFPFLVAAIQALNGTLLKCEITVALSIAELRDLLASRRYNVLESINQRIQ